MSDEAISSKVNLAEISSSHNGIILKGTKDPMADGDADITPPPLPLAEQVAQNISDLLRTYGGDEDDFSQSASSTDVGDNSAASSIVREGKRKIDIHGDWQRDGSLESATSTDISSLCSSTVVTTDKTTIPSLNASPSKKRMSDGSLKATSIRLDPKTEIRKPIPSLPVEETRHSHSAASSPIPKRRGRPLKEKHLSNHPVGSPRRASTISKLASEVRPRSSIPYRLPANVFASQCIEAAHAARLNPYSLHPSEHALLVNLLLNKEVTVYLNIRNAILRLWRQNPLCSVTAQEAAGCAKEARFFGLAEVSYKWLVRNGYINFGCVQVPQSPESLARVRRTGKQRIVVVVGAGVSGLTTARQLEGLFAQDAAKWTDAGEIPPRVVVIEGRNRVGGRVYSKKIRQQAPGTLPDSLMNTAEMGAMIVTGFEHGNPLDTVIRGQLGLRYHLMKDALTIYDTDGRPIQEQRDMLNTDLYTDISDRAGEFRLLPQETETLRGDEDLISRSRDPAPDGYENFQLEPLFDPLDSTHKPKTRRGRRRNAPPGTEKLTGRSQIVEGSSATNSAARAALSMGWELKEGVAKNQSISLRSIANASEHPTLGTVMDEAIKQYRDLIDLTPQDMRLLNWHHANLEYANAAPVTSLSLSGHDQDTGNEFEGAHSEIIGGYTQLPRGLMSLPTKLDVRTKRVVDSIHYNQDAFRESEYSTKVVCTSGEVIEADEVVLTVPLGVLKSDMIDFDPPLPDWKRGAIERLGFGLLNKVILLYEHPFWDDDRDMFGLLNEAEYHDSLDPKHYAKSRGKSYLIWNASKISGRPMLVALMAGHAAYEAEKTPAGELMDDIVKRLYKVYKNQAVLEPREIIVTRWKRDPFTRGTYSYVAPETRPGDYDVMAQSVGNLHFAGEATCGTHPATVHGAFLSGLRVAAEVMDAMAGPISLPMPLVGPAPVKVEKPPVRAVQVPFVVGPAPPLSSIRDGDRLQQFEWPTSAAQHIKQEPTTPSLDASVPPAPASVPQRPAGPPRQSVCAGDPSFWAQPTSDFSSLDHEAAIIGTILSQIGERPVKPSRPGVNPFLLFTKAKWDECKTFTSSGNGSKSGTAGGREDIRSTLGKWWKAMDDEQKVPWIRQSREAQEIADEARKEWEQKVAEWDREAGRIRREFIAIHPAPPMSERASGKPAVGAGGVMDGIGVSKRKTNVSNCVVLDHS